MKCLIPEIFWHNRDPVLSVDIQPKPLENENKIRLASGGYDSHVLIWYLSENEDGLPQLELASDLTRHTKPVSVVRWSPSGQFLASGDDDSAIFIWKLKADSDASIFDDSNEQNKETWIIFKTLRGHLEDVLDLSWSMDSTHLATGEVGCMAIVWDVMKGKSKLLLNDHKNFVQGVAWDPKDKFLATISTDRTLRIFDVKTGKVQRRINRSTYPVDESSPLYNKKIRLFHDDMLPTFYRRLTYTPDGNLLIVPSGCTDIIVSNNENQTQAENKEAKENQTDDKETKEKESKETEKNKDDLGGDVPNENPSTSKEVTVEKAEKVDKMDKPSKLLNTTYIFTRYSKQPAVVIPSADHFTVAVRCCPTIFKLRSHNENCPPIIDLPYRMIFAIASKSSIYLYDTQQRLPFGSISNIHYSRLTDITWSSDGKVLIVSSFDGFCTLISFEDGELGEVYDQPINLNEPDDKENASKKKRNSNDKTKVSPKEKNNIEPKADQQSEALLTITTTTMTTTEKQQVVSKVKPKIEIPETMIATAESFESPENKEKQATPIAIRRAPRTNPTTPSTSGATPKSFGSDSAASSKKPKLITVRRQPRNILTAPIELDKSNADQDEALDAWPIPIDSVKLTTEMETKKSNDENNDAKQEKECQSMAISEETENMHLIYEGDSEITLIKTDTVSTPNANVETKKSEVPSTSEPNGTPDTNNRKTPRRVQFRTISTPKSKKKLIN